MFFFVLIVAAGILVVWIISELQPNTHKVTRVVLGLLSIVLVTTGFQMMTSVTQAYERENIIKSLNAIKELIEAGNSKPVINAINRFQSTKQNEGYVNAASTLWHECDPRTALKGKTSNRVAGGL